MGIDYRDDDINVHTCITSFMRIHSVFQRFGRIHTVACEMKDLWANKELFWLLLTDPLINVELHGWTHEDYASWPAGGIMRHFQHAIDYWNENALRMAGLAALPPLKTITTYCPTWNRVTPAVEEACRELGLVIDRGTAKWQFHYWSTTAKEAEEQLR